jgi:hypothetical protein
MRVPTLIVAAVLLGACTTVPRTMNDGIILRHTPEQPAPGDAVMLILDNGSAEVLGYNLCTSTLSRQVGAEWEPLRSDRVCTLELRSLEPGQQAQFPIDLPHDLAPGTYRFHTTVERFGTGTSQEIAAEPFTISGP